MGIFIFPQTIFGVKIIQKIFEKKNTTQLVGWLGCWVFPAACPVGWLFRSSTNFFGWVGWHSQGQAHAPASGQLGHGHLKPAPEIWYQQKTMEKAINEKQGICQKSLETNHENKNIFFLFHLISYDDLDTTFAFSWWIFQFLLERKGSGLMLPFHEPRYLIVNMSLNFFITRQPITFPTFFLFSWYPTSIHPSRARSLLSFWSPCSPRKIHLGFPTSFQEIPLFSSYQLRHRSHLAPRLSSGPQICCFRGIPTEASCVFWRGAGQKRIEETQSLSIFDVCFGEIQWSLMLKVAWGTLMLRHGATTFKWTALSTST